MIRTPTRYAGSSRRTPSAPRWTTCRRSAAWRCWRAPASSCSPAAASRSTKRRRQTCPSAPHPAAPTMTRTRTNPGCSSSPTTPGAPARPTAPRRAPPVWLWPAENAAFDLLKDAAAEKIHLITIFSFLFL
jgi:hypothetical protein